jgi:hypothetical protein
MGWLLKQRKPLLYGLVKHALENGLAEQLSTLNSMDRQVAVEELQGTLLEFLSFLEESLLDALQNVKFDEAQGEALKISLKKIDLQNIDIQTVWKSLQQTQSALGDKNNTNDLTMLDFTMYHESESFVPAQTAQDLLYKNLLHNWEPNEMHEKPN